MAGTSRRRHREKRRSWPHRRGRPADRARIARANGRPPRTPYEADRARTRPSRRARGRSVADAGIPRRRRAPHQAIRRASGHRSPPKPPRSARPAPLAGTTNLPRDERSRSPVPSLHQNLPRGPPLSGDGEIRSGRDVEARACDACRTAHLGFLRGLSVRAHSRRMSVGTASVTADRLSWLDDASVSGTVDRVLVALTAAGGRLGRRLARGRRLRLARVGRLLARRATGARTGPATAGPAPSGRGAVPAVSIGVRPRIGVTGPGGFPGTVVRRGTIARCALAVRRCLIACGGPAVGGLAVRYGTGSS